MTTPEVSPSSSEPSSLGHAAACAISEHLDTRTAGMEIADALFDDLAGPCDLVMVFASFQHRAALPEAAETIRRTLDPGVLMAVTAESVLGGDVELEGVAGMSAVALRLPGATLTPWMATPSDPINLDCAHTVAQRINLTEDFRAAIMLAEPFTTPISRLLPMLCSCGGAKHTVPIVGGMASGGNQPNCNVLVLDDRVITGGVVGVSIAGDVDIDCLVSQGCRPVGPSFVVTKVNGNVVLELGGRPALDVLNETGSNLPEHERELLRKGVLIGHLIDHTKTHFGRGDFLVRSVLGVDKEQNGIVAGDVPRLGQTVQFHARDARTAEEDLRLLLDAQMLHDPPLGAVMFSCNGRGKKLYGESNRDITIVRERLGEVPIAGFFAAGELGPVGPQSYVHGHSASIALFRPRPRK